MRKLKLDVDTLRVESFALGPRTPPPGTVRGHDGPGGRATFTCIGPTYCCPPTWKPSCETCPSTCPWIECGPL